MLVHLILSQRFLRLSSILFILFPLFCSSAVISIILSSSSLIHSSASVILLWVSARAFLGFALGGKVWLSGLYWFLLGVPCVCVLEGGNQADNYRNNRTYTHTSLMVQSVKTPPACERLGFDPRFGKIPWRREWLPLQYSCLENSTDRGAWWATDNGIAKSQTQLSD